MKTNMKIINFNKFLDFDNNNQVFYYNIYLKNYKLAIKIPISESKKEKHIENIKIEKFDPIKYKFLLNCEQK